MDLQPVHRPNAARHVPIAAVPGVHNDAMVFTGEYSIIYVAQDTTVVRLHIIKNIDIARQFFFFLCILVKYYFQSATLKAINSDGLQNNENK